MNSLKLNLHAGYGPASRFLLLLSVCLLLVFPVARGAASPLFARGYTVIPEPRQVTLRAGDFRFGPGWRLEAGEGVASGAAAVQVLKEDLQSRFHLRLGSANTAGGTLRLAIHPNSVIVGKALDRNKEALARQAYAIELSKDRVSITANAPQGLFYGVETFIQLLRSRDGVLWLPEGRIVDWPDLERRHIYWDDNHHLDHMDTLKRAIRQAAFYKINGFVIKLNGHFQYRSAPAVVEPYALSPAQFQELTDYGLRYYVQLIPYLDGPAHIAFILKHPEYRKLRADPRSNYELCVTNPDSYKLLFGMYRDLLDANKGVKYFYLSTDEPYYVGMADNAQCREAPDARKLGSVGKLLARFTTKTADYLHDRGRTVIFWGEYPLKTGDIASLPAHLVNGEVYDPKFDPVFKAHGIRQMIYVSTEGVEQMFPSYFALPAAWRVHPSGRETERIASAFEKISTDPARKYADLIGVNVAAWGDMGLHPETFWLGYATITAAAWRPGSPDPREAMSSFYRLFYGQGATNVDRLYQLMSLQAQFWQDSWDRVPSKARKPIFGDSEGIYERPRPAYDQAIPLPPVPAPANLEFSSNWRKQNARRLALASRFLAQNEELFGLLNMNLRQAEFNHYNLEVYLSIAKLYRQNLEMLQGLGKINGFLETARSDARANKPRAAVAQLDQALGIARRIRRRRNDVLREATATWYRSWFPRVAQANGRRFLHELDDVKDHLPDRTVDMRYLVYRELLLPFGGWFEKVEATRNHYARTHQLPVNTEKFDWASLGTPD